MICDTCIDKKELDSGKFYCKLTGEIYIFVDSCVFHRNHVFREVDK